MCTTVHAWCLQTTARTTRVPTRTRNTRTLPHGRQVCYCTRTPRNDRSEDVRAPHTWARPPTCTPCRPPDHQLMRASVVMLQYPRSLATRGHTRLRVQRTTCAAYTAVWFLTSVCALVVILQTPFLSFRYVLVVISHSTPRPRSGRFPQLRAMRGQKLLRADAHAPWLVHELAVYNASASSDSESARSDSPHANQTNPSILSQHPPATSETSSSDDDIPLQQLFAEPPMDGHDAIPAACAYGQPLSPSRAPAATPAGPAFQPRQLLRSEPRPAAEGAGQAGAPADSPVAVDPPPLGSQATRSSPLPLAGAASRTVEADPGLL